MSEIYIEQGDYVSCDYPALQPSQISAYLNFERAFAAEQSQPRPRIVIEDPSPFDD